MPTNKTQQPPRHRAGEQFLKGPIPLLWLQKAATLSGKTLAVSLALWFKAGLTRNRVVHLTHNLAERLSVGRRATARCLKLLEDANLVTVERHQGRCPVVTILEVSNSNSTVCQRIQNETYCGDERKEPQNDA